MFDSFEKIKLTLTGTDVKTKLPTLRGMVEGGLKNGAVAHCFRVTPNEAKRIQVTLQP